MRGIHTGRMGKRRLPPADNYSALERHFSKSNLVSPGSLRVIVSVKVVGLITGVCVERRAGAKLRK